MKFSFSYLQHVAVEEQRHEQDQVVDSVVVSLLEAQDAQPTPDRRVDDGDGELLRPRVELELEHVLDDDDELQKNSSNGSSSKLEAVNV